MKLFEVVHSDWDDWDGVADWVGMINGQEHMTEDDMIKAVNSEPSLIEDLYDKGYKPSERVRWAALAGWPWGVSIMGNDATDEMKSYALQHPDVVEYKDLYDEFVGRVYPGNALMQKKWIRYGDKTR